MSFEDWVIRLIFNEYKGIYMFTLQCIAAHTFVWNCIFEIIVKKSLYFYYLYS